MTWLTELTPAQCRLVWLAIARLADGPRPTFLKVGEGYVNMAFIVTVIIQQDGKWAQARMDAENYAETQDAAEIAALRDWCERGKE